MSKSLKNNMINLRAAMALMVVLATFSLKAETPDIVKHITEGRVNEVVMPEALYRLLLSEETMTDDTDLSAPEAAAPVKQGHQAGYRVQVFSDNNPRTAKNEARSKSRNISSRLPQYRTYVVYTSPYWRLKVGDFRTQAEAEAAAEELKNVFPSYSKEIRVVRDKVNL